MFSTLKAVVFCFIINNKNIFLSILYHKFKKISTYMFKYTQIFFYLQSYTGINIVIQKKQDLYLLNHSYNNSLFKKFIRLGNFFRFLGLSGI